jgi:hypothetical protein
MKPDIPNDAARIIAEWQHNHTEPPLSYIARLEIERLELRKNYTQLDAREKLAEIDAQIKYAWSVVPFWRAAYGSSTPTHSAWDQRQ